MGVERYIGPKCYCDSDGGTEMHHEGWDGVTKLKI